MQILLRAPTDLDELDRRIATERLAMQRDRYRVVRLALTGMKTMDIAATLDRSRDFVQTWAYAYRDGGIGQRLGRGNTHAHGTENATPWNGRRTLAPSFTRHHLGFSDARPVMASVAKARE